MRAERWKEVRRSLSISDCQAALKSCKQGLCWPLTVQWGDALKRYKSRLTTDQQKEPGRGALQNTLVLEIAKLNTQLNTVQHRKIGRYRN